MDPELGYDSPPPGSPSSAASEGGHSDDGGQSDLVRKMEKEVEDLLAILRDAGTEIDDDLATEIDYKISRIEAMRDAAINKSIGSKAWRYFIKPAATVLGHALLYTATAFLGSYLVFVYIFRPKHWWRLRPPQRK